MDQWTSIGMIRQQRARLWQLLLFFVVAPVIVSCVETFLQLSMVVNGDLAVSLGFALLFTVPGTFFAWLMTWLIARLPGAERLALPLLLLLGFAASLLVFRPYNRFIYDLIPVAAPHVKVATSSAWQEVSRFIFVNVPGALIWMGLNLLFIARIGFPVYGRPAAETLPAAKTSPAAASILPEFCRLAGIDTLSDLWAISAEEHYLRLHGRFGTKMIRHSFGSAVEQMPPGCGLQVHRSHWVAFGRVLRIEADKESGKAPQLVLADGTMLPVSNRYHQAVLLTESQLLAA